ncbi:MAG: endonuclease, partial [Candidatus Izemoplasmatales bacterium]|nr:endonuclease [Candidatus Izemoplasmatales bacterium]
TVVSIDAVIPNVNYFVNASLNLENAKLIVFYDDGSSSIIELTSNMVDSFTSSSSGTRSLTITYQGKTDYINYVVSKQIPSYVVPTFTNITYTSDMTLANIPLPSNFSWLFPQTVLSIGSWEATVVFTPNDTNVYEIVENILVSFDVVAYNTPVVIYEIYGGGGNSGAIYNYDYVILYNTTSLSINLGGYSIQYSSATGTSYTATALTGSIYPNSYYVIRFGTNNQEVGSAIPIAHSVSSNTNLAATAGKIALVASTSSISSQMDASVVDFVGYGTTANESETAPTSILSNSTSAKRTSIIDTNNNVSDFSVSTANLNYLLDSIALVGFSIRNFTSSYELNASLNLTNAEILRFYSNGTSSAIPLTAEMVSNFSSSAYGTFQITVTYGVFQNQVPYQIVDYGSHTMAEVHFIDIGAMGGKAGEATLIKIGAIDILIDSGDNDTASQNALLEFLASKVTDSIIEYVIATHPDADHIGGFSSIFNLYTVSNVVQYSTGPTSTTLRQTYEALIVSEGSVVYYVYDIVTTGNSSISISQDVELQFYNTTYLQSTNTNASSIVLTLNAFSTKVLLNGDAEGNQENVYGSLVGDVDIFKLGHHGASAGTTSALLNVIKPEVAIVSNGDYLGNSYGHPTYSAIGRIYSYSNNLPVYAVTGGNGSAVSRTHQRNGTITVKIEPTGYLVSSANYGINPFELSKTDYWKSSSNPNNHLGYYYKEATGITDGALLKAAIHQIIRGHTSYSYDAVKTHLQSLDEDPSNSNNILLFYTGRSQAKSTFGTNANDWNREHIWAQSHGIDYALPAYTDLHHLRATDVSVNSARGDKDFSSVAKSSSTLVNDTYGPGSTFNYMT